MTLIFFSDDAFLKADSYPCHVKCAEKSVKTMTSNLEKYAQKNIENWNNIQFFVLLVKKKSGQIQYLTPFCNQKRHFVFPLFLLNRLNECVCEVKSRKIELM